MQEKFLIKLFFSLMDPPTQHNNVLLQNTLSHSQTPLPFFFFSFSLFLSLKHPHTCTRTHSKSLTYTLECRVKTTHATNAIQNSNLSLTHSLTNTAQLAQSLTHTHTHTHSTLSSFLFFHSSIKFLLGTFPIQFNYFFFLLLQHLKPSKQNRFANLFRLR